MKKIVSIEFLKKAVTKLKKNKKKIYIYSKIFRPKKSH